MADVPGDDHVAATMRGFAETFVNGTAAEGEVFGWDTASALRLDDLCERFLASGPAKDVQHSMTIAMGAYLGELVVRNGRGRWVWHPVARNPAVELSNGSRCFPLFKVAKRLAHGREHNLWAFYDFMMTGRIAPDMKLTPRGDWDPDAR